MKASLRALMTGVIDYAGLFPPAQLPLEEAIRNDSTYRNGSDAWMLGLFVCPAAKLKDLDVVPPLSVVGRGGATVEDALVGRQQDRQDMTTLVERRLYARIGGYEVRLCNELLFPERSQDLSLVLSGHGQSGSSFFAEVGYGPRWSESVDILLSALAACPSASQSNLKGLKIRCGGATAALVPSAADIAFALAACHKAGVSAKFTAGLHHPLRRDDSALGTKTHGFLNVFVAGVLCHARGCDAAALQPVIEDEDPKHFRFEDDGLCWKALHATTEEVIAARKQAVISFGSCSFDEPREDLRSLGLFE